MDNKIINIMCFCKISLQWKRDEVIMLNPCEHLVHKSCYNNWNHILCPVCKKTVKSITRAKDYKKNHKLYQKCVDILSATNHDDKTKVTYDDTLLINVLCNLSIVFTDASIATCFVPISFK